MPNEKTHFSMGAVSTTQILKILSYDFYRSSLRFSASLRYISGSMRRRHTSEFNYFNVTGNPQ